MSSSDIIHFMTSLVELLKQHGITPIPMPAKKPTKEVLAYIAAIKKGREILKNLGKSKTQ